jgi:BolA protein
MAVANEIENRLRDAFSPRSLTVEDQSERHRGHAGWREGGETHFHVTIAAPAFDEMSRIDRHRAIHAALGPELVGRIHALSLDVKG